jgi:hypothetical protein
MANTFTCAAVSVRKRWILIPHVLEIMLLISPNFLVWSFDNHIVNKRGKLELPKNYMAFL